MQALERRLLIAESTLEVSPEEDVQMADIREEDDAAVLSQGGSGTGAAQMPDSNAAQMGARRSAAVQPEDVSSAAAAAAAAAAGRMPNGKAAPTRAGGLAADPEDQALASGQAEGGIKECKRSVSFAEAPLRQGSEATAQPKAQGLKKGFLGRSPKSVLKKTSSQLDDSSPSHERFENTGHTAPAVGSRGQAQAEIDQGRDTAFSGKVVERSGSSAALHYPPCASAAGQGSNQRHPVDSIKKVSKFKQERQGQG